ncbi:hypothetical protein FQA39_LY14145 [Lamprigera yunnana]|nr:hypothetical protein FQA39_LY14145 [Lamprigera yunnana]
MVLGEIIYGLCSGINVTSVNEDKHKPKDFGSSIGPELIVVSVTVALVVVALCVVHYSCIPRKIKIFSNREEESDPTERELEVNATVSENENSNIVSSHKQPERTNNHTDQSREQNDQSVQSNVQTTGKGMKKRKKTASINADDISDETLSEAFQLLQQSAQPPQPDTDSYITFRQSIFTELRKHDAVTLTYVKNAICQVFFQTDTGRYGDRNYGYYSNSLAHLQPPLRRTLSLLILRIFHFHLHSHHQLLI